MISIDVTLLTSADEPLLPIIEEAVVECLLRVRRQTTPGVRGAQLSRYGARLLNTFEEGRENTHVFVNVQNVGSLRRYGGWWSGIIAYLLRTHLSSDNCAEDSAEPCLKPAIDGDILEELAAVVTHAEDTLDARREGNTNPRSPSSIKSGRDSDPEDQGLARASVRCFRALRQAVTRLSTGMVRQQYGGDIFASPIVSYAALRALADHGGWLPSDRFTPILSGLIHCSQLWLAAYCIGRHSEARSDLLALDQTLKVECGLYLLNNKRGPVSELSYWRLMAGLKNNDSVRPPTTLINADRTKITHRD